MKEKPKLVSPIPHLPNCRNARGPRKGIQLNIILSKTLDSKTDLPRWVAAVCRLHIADLIRQILL